MDSGYSCYCSMAPAQAAKQKPLCCAYLCRAAHSSPAAALAASTGESELGLQVLLRLALARTSAAGKLQACSLAQDTLQQYI